MIAEDCCFRHIDASDRPHNLYRLIAKITNK